MSDPDFVPQTLYFPLTDVHWRQLHQVLARLDSHSPERLQLARTLDSIQTLAATQFAMVSWSLADVANAIARERGAAVDYGDDTSAAEAGVEPADLARLAGMLHAPVVDAMTTRGWEALEALVEVGPH